MSELKLYEGLIVNIPSILFAMFAGSWADLRGRKVILALPFLGTVNPDFAKNALKVVFAFPFIRRILQFSYQRLVF